MHMYDVLIIGGGYAGLSAALWLGRFHRSVAVISSGPVRNATSGVMHGYPGLDGKSPLELLKSIQTEAANYGVIYINARTERVSKQDDSFTVTTSKGEYIAKRLMLATGTEDTQPDIPGFTAFRGRTAWHCPACDGHEYTDKRIALIGWHKDIAGYAEEFLSYTKPQNITVYTHGHPEAASSSVRSTLERDGMNIEDEPIARLDGTNGQLEQIILASGRAAPADALFYNIAQKPRLELFEQLGCELAEGAVQVNQQQETSVPGVYAAGDITPFQDLVVVACSTGTIAASSIHESLDTPNMP